MLILYCTTTYYYILFHWRCMYVWYVLLNSTYLLKCWTIVRESPLRGSIWPQVIGPQRATVAASDVIDCRRTRNGPWSRRQKTHGVFRSLPGNQLTSASATVSMVFTAAISSSETMHDASPKHRPIFNQLNGSGCQIVTHTDTVK